ncbi:MAG TPA: hypothetical protein PKB14_25495 [Rubrivivax sp.]|nr:hypothetical protein [Rubrivivax sp.]
MRQPDPELVAAIEAAFMRRCREAGCWISGDGRVSEDSAAALLGLAPGTLANRRAEGSAPAFYRIGGPGCRTSYSLHDLAVWLAAHRVG